MCGFVVVEPKEGNGVFILVPHTIYVLQIITSRRNLIPLVATSRYDREEDTTLFSF